MPPLFSIIIPVYRSGPFLRDCLDSIRNQTLTDWECICINDGSPDDSGAILDEYARKDARFTAIHQDNRGVSAARNAGLSVARGNWTAFVDGDDTVEPDMLACLHEEALRAQEAAVCDSRVSFGMTFHPVLQFVHHLYLLYDSVEVGDGAGRRRDALGGTDELTVELGENQDRKSVV